MDRRTRCGFAVLTAVSCLLLGSGTARAGNVTNTNDSGAGSLRQVVADAVPGEVITFFANSQVVRTIRLFFPIVLDKNLTLQGPGARMFTIAAGNFDARLFEVSAGVTVNVSGLRFFDARVGGQSGVFTSDGVGESRMGGAILNNGTLNVSASDFHNNGVSGGSGRPAEGASTSNGVGKNGGRGRGGAIYNAGTLRVESSLFRGNTASGGGGGDGASTGSNTNGAGEDGEGGAIYNTGTATLINCTFASNQALGGNPGRSLGNSALGAPGDARGGAVANATDRTITIVHSTVAGNSVTAGAGSIDQTSTFGQARGGGIDLDGEIAPPPGSTKITLSNTIVAGNSFVDSSSTFTTAPASTKRGPDVNGTSNGSAAGAASGDFNLLGDPSGSSLPGTHNKSGAALLGPLKNNGGPIDTILPMSSSPAVDAGLSNVLTPTADARNLRRVVDFPGVAASAGSDNTDIGATELGDPAASLLVTTTGDSASDLSGTTLRSAIEYANATDGAQTIGFNIPAGLATGNVWIISPARALPVLSDAGTTIDGSTQTSVENRNPQGPEIVLDGTTTTGLGLFAAIEFGADNGTVRGLNVRNFRFRQIQTTVSPPAGESYDGCGVFACYIGTDETGLNGTTRGDTGVQLFGSNHRVGAPDANGNLIAGFSGASVNVSGTSGSNNRVQNNIIGLNRSADALIVRAGATNDVGVLAGGVGNIVGGTSAGEGNTIGGVAIAVGVGGNTSDAANETALPRDNRVQNNTIGTNAGGASGLGCAAGVLVEGALGTVIADNRIANCGTGVVLSGVSTTSPSFSPVRNTAITSNTITNAGGRTPRTDAGPHGVQVIGTFAATNNTISLGSISGSAGAGVHITGAGATGNRVSAVRLGANVGGDIDLGGEGVTPNDAGDGDTGPNTLQNFPVLTGASPGAINGTLNSTPSATFRIEFFSKPSSGGDPRGTFLGFVNATTDANGNAAFSFAATGLTVGDSVVATATGTGGTSEFSAPTTVSSPAATSGAIISEFRLRGLNGSTDEFIELLNTTDSPLNISGWSVNYTGAASPITIPSGTASIPARGHYLLAHGTGYSLGSLSAPNQTYTVDIPSDATLTLSNAVPSVVDTAGATSAPTADGQFSLVRLSNVADSAFTLVSTSGASFGSTQAAILGAPGPQNLVSLVAAPSGLLTETAFDTGTASNVRPNRDRRLRFSASPALGTGADKGTMLIRRTIKNNSTTQTITKLRFRVTALTTLNNRSGSQADLRLLSSGKQSVVRLSTGVADDVFGTVLEAPAQPVGGGLNSSAIENGDAPAGTNVGIPTASTTSTGTLTLGAPLGPGQSRSYNFLFGVEQDGNYSVTLQLEAEIN